MNEFLEKELSLESSEDISLELDKSFNKLESMDNDYENAKRLISVANHASDPRLAVESNGIKYITLEELKEKYDDSISLESKLMVQKFFATVLEDTIWTFADFKAEDILFDKGTVTRAKERYYSGKLSVLTGVIFDIEQYRLPLSDIEKKHGEMLPGLNKGFDPSKTKTVETIIYYGGDYRPLKSNINILSVDGKRENTKIKFTEPEFDDVIEFVKNIIKISSDQSAMKKYKKDIDGVTAFIFGKTKDVDNYEYNQKLLRASMTNFGRSISKIRIFINRLAIDGNYQGK